MNQQTNPEIFEIIVPVLESDIDELHHVNNVVYLRWVQDVAIAHWRQSATPEQQAEIAWVVVRHEIDYKHPARLGDQIVARTWVGPASERTFARFTEMFRAADLQLLARARSLWFPIGMKTGKFIEVGPEVRERFSVPESPGG
jgi:acyl-CoA thioester hydrolase